MEGHGHSGLSHSETCDLSLCHMCFWRNFLRQLLCESHLHSGAGPSGPLGSGHTLMSDNLCPESTKLDSQYLVSHSKVDLFSSFSSRHTYMLTESSQVLRTSEFDMTVCCPQM